MNPVKIRFTWNIANRSLCKAFSFYKLQNYYFYVINKKNLPLFACILIGSIIKIVTNDSMNKKIMI